MTIENIKSKKTIGIFLFAVLVIMGGLYAKSYLFQKDKGEVLGEALASDNLSVPIETVGNEQVQEMDDLGISWPGEIISLGDVEVQPQREGTIMEWKVNIGQKVSKGQVLGRLSAPPATPELIKMLSEQAEGLAKARGQSQAIADFAEKNKQQLLTLKEQLKINNTDKSFVLNLDGTNTGGNSGLAKIALEQAREVGKAKQQNLRTVSEEILNRHIYRLTTSNGLKSFRANTVINGYGVVDSPSLYEFDSVVSKLVVEIKNPETLPIDTMRKYLDLVLRVVNASVPSNFSDSDLKESRMMVADDRELFFDALSDYREAQMNAGMKEAEFKLMSLDQNKEFAEQVKEINEKISMLEKEQQMAVAEVKASQVAFSTVANSINGGLNITASQNGVISSVYKKNGEFVEPGMPIASINAGENKERFVRFHIPGNLAIPETGTELTIMRPGFPNEIKKVKFIGAGTALNSNGSYSADAQFIGQIDWPVRASVRVMPPIGFISDIVVPLASVWWDNKAQAQIWLVTEENRIRPQQIKIGRTLGNKLEVLEGLEKGNRFVSKITLGLTAGQAIADIKTEDKQNINNKNQEAGGHGDGDEH